jgi:hypothetical protein
MWIGVLPAPVDAQTSLEQQPQTAAPRESMAPKAPVVYRNGRLTIDVSDDQMQRLLADIGTRTRIAIDSLEVVGDRRVTVSAVDLAPDEALRRLLTGYDAFFLSGSSAGKPAALTTVWIYPKGEGASLVPLSPEAWMSTADALKAATDPDPAIRARALEELSERADSSSDAMAALINGRHDADDSRGRQGLHLQLAYVCVGSRLSRRSRHHSERLQRFGGEARGHSVQRGSKRRRGRPRSVSAAKRPANCRARRWPPM